MADLLAWAALALWAVGLLAVVKGSVSSLRIRSRGQGLLLILAGILIAGLYGEVSPPTDETPSRQDRQATATAGAIATKAAERDALLANVIANLPPLPTFPAITFTRKDTSAAGQTRYIANTGRQGVRLRTSCSDAGGSGGWAEGQEVTVLYTQDGCNGWYYVQTNSTQSSWVREEYLSPEAPIVGSGPGTTPTTTTAAAVEGSVEILCGGRTILVLPLGEKAGVLDHYNAVAASNNKMVEAKVEWHQTTGDLKEYGQATASASFVAASSALVLALERETEVMAQTTGPARSAEFRDVLLNEGRLELQYTTLLRDGVLQRNPDLWNQAVDLEPSLVTTDERSRRAIADICNYLGA